MSIPIPKDRPDYDYWITPWAERKHPNSEELEAILVKLEEYSLLRFTLGRLFELNRDFQGIPKGIRCIIVDIWPKTKVRWHKYSNFGRGSLRESQSLLFELDNSLDILL